MKKKLIVDRDVYEALETLKKIYGNDDKCLIKLHSTEAKWEGIFNSLNKLGTYEFAKAVLIGYELDKTPEEKLADLYNELDKKDRFDYAYGCGIDAALNILDIKVKGINE